MNAPEVAPQSGTGLPAGDAFDVHRQMVLSLFVATLFLSVALSVGLWFSSVTMLMLVGAGGALGGFVSGLRRLYAFQRVFPVHFFKTRRRVDAYLIVYSMIPSLVGTIAAITLYLIFASQLIKGDMFPAFHLSAVNPRSDDFQNFIWNWQPITSADFAKALVWSFLAGFSERFVPDLLDRLASTQQPKEEPDHRATDTPEEQRQAASRRRTASRRSTT